MRARRDVTVVKLGGSFAFAPELGDWLATLARCAGHVVLVPGGGVFADSVRHAQSTMAFDDDAAHHMALLAMEQFGRALASLDARMSPAATIAAIDATLRAQKVPVWSPTRMVLQADIPASWDMTSDSLAAWLAQKLGAPRLLLVKRTRPAGTHVDVAQLVADEIVDPLFPEFLARSRAAAAVAGPADHAAAATALCGGDLFGTTIELG
jgi:5-(aminomethyl)-3-furanmethanol phosphate kinase